MERRMDGKEENQLHQSFLPSGSQEDLLADDGSSTYSTPYYRRMRKPRWQRFPVTAPVLIPVLIVLNILLSGVVIVLANKKPTDYDCASQLSTYCKRNVDVFTPIASDSWSTRPVTS